MDRSEKERKRTNVTAAEDEVQKGNPQTNICCEKGVMSPVYFPSWTHLSFKKFKVLKLRFLGLENKT
ncbi:hypothetical protein C0J52_04167 [Blattella germanica]|nr:hypothetical protein C0J52_04167 [Blattella germanica]